MNSLKSSDVINFLKTQELNSNIGKMMLGDSNAMYKDIFGKHASEKLKGECPFHKKKKSDEDNTLRCNIL